MATTLRELLIYIYLATTFALLAPANTLVNEEKPLLCSPTCSSDCLTLNLMGVCISPILGSPAPPKICMCLPFLTTPIPITTLQKPPCALCLPPWPVITPVPGLAQCSVGEAEALSNVDYRKLECVLVLP